MPQFELDIGQASRGLLRIANFADLAVEPIKEALSETAAAVRATAVAELSAGGTGRLYSRGRQRFRGDRARNVTGGSAIAFHRASSPGQPPASDSGRLLRSVRASLAKQARGGSLRAGVLAPAFYGFMLESGAGRVSPRPFLVPAAEAHVSDFVARVQAAIDEAAQRTSALVSG